MRLSLSMDKENGCDRFSYKVENGVLKLEGSSNMALCRAFYEYVRNMEAGINSWSGNRLELPSTLPDAPSVEKVSPFKHHYYFNVVTYGYTLCYWDWERWEQEIDWMALHGIDMPLALVANEAITARVFLLAAFSSTVAGGAFPKAVDAVSSATPLELIGVEGAELPSLLDMFLGLRGGAIGEGCILALLLGFAYLLVRRVIRWQTPVIFVGTVFVLSLIATGSLTAATYEILAGGLVLGAVFMATDYSTTPLTLEGKALFALGCGVITFVIRFFCAYPEGVSFSILCMNILAPWLEKWTRRKPLGGV